MDYQRVAQIKQAQEERMSKQSWDYLNQNDPQYAEIVVKKEDILRLPYLKYPSVNDVRKALESWPPTNSSPN